MQIKNIILAGLWIALMFTYLLGDILRVYSGDILPGKLFGKKTSQTMYLGIAIFMFIPILMIILNLLVSDNNILHWINLITTTLLFLINIVRVPSYKSRYDILLIIFWQAYI